MIPLNYHHLYYFFTIAREGSIARACEKLYLAQPTLSTQLKQFEKAIGKRLFDRNNRRLTLTEEGRMVLDYAESIFELGSELRDAINDRPAAGLLAIQIGVLSGTPRSFAHAMVESVLDHAPAAHVSLREAYLDNLVLDLKEHRLDLVLSDVAALGHEQGELDNHLIAQVPVVLAASPALARRYPRVPDSLKEAPFILPSLPSQVYHQTVDQLSAWKITPRIVAEVQDVELARRLAVAGRGITPLNTVTLAASLPKGGLVPLAGGPLSIRESVYLITRKRKIRHPLTEYLVGNFRLDSGESRPGGRRAKAVRK